MEQSIKFIGVDLHKATLAVAVADGGGGEDRYLGEIANKEYVGWKNVNSALR